VRVTEAGRYIGTSVDGQARLVTVEEYRARLARRLVEEVPKCPAAATRQALIAQFARAGTDGRESPEVFRLPEVVGAGGLAALKSLGKPAEILRETKARLPELKRAVEPASESIALLVHRAVMPTTEQRQVRQRGGAPLRPVVEMMALTKADSAPGEAAAPVSMLERAA
jgi:hypothetical protein